MKRQPVVSDYPLNLNQKLNMFSAQILVTLPWPNQRRIPMSCSRHAQSQTEDWASTSRTITMEDMAAVVAAAGPLVAMATSWWPKSWAAKSRHKIKQNEYMCVLVDLLYTGVGTEIGVDFKSILNYFCGTPDSVRVWYLFVFSIYLLGDLLYFLHTCMYMWSYNVPLCAIIVMYLT